MMRVNVEAALTGSSYYKTWLPPRCAVLFCSLFRPIGSVRPKLSAGLRPQYASCLAWQDSVKSPCFDIHAVEAASEQAQFL
eukprot:128452-Pleurochrysis_carterae.AAC.1